MFLLWQKTKHINNDWHEMLLASTLTLLWYAIV